MQPLRPIKDVWPKHYNSSTMAGILTAAANTGNLLQADRPNNGARVEIPSPVMVIWDLPDRSPLQCPYTIYAYYSGVSQYHPWFPLEAGRMLFVTYFASDLLKER